MAEELPDAPWATNNAGNDDLPDAPWVTAQKPSAGGLSNSSDDGFLSSAAKGAATAGIKGIANSIGTVGNLGNFADYLIGRAHSAITGRPFEEVAADLAARKAASARVTDPSRVLPTGEEVAKPILERTGEYKPESLAGRLGMAGVEAAAGMIGPGGGAVTKGTSAGQALISTPTKLAPVNALAGATGQGVTEATGDPLIGMAAGIGAPAAASAARRAVQPTVDKMIAPFAEDLPIVGNRYAGTRENLVRQQIEQSANDLGELQRQLMVDEPGPLNQELVPGSQPTTGQLTGDKGVLSAEREKLFDAKDQRFLDRMEAQEGARRAALEGQGPGGDVDRPSAFFQNQLETIQRGADEAVARITAGAEQLAQRIGHGESPENLGATLRASLERVKRSENEARRKLYDAVDPDGSLNLVSVPVRDAAAKIKGGVDPYGTPLSQVENDILARMASLPDVAPYKSLQALDTYITGEMKRERMSAGESIAWGRLKLMKDATMSAINDAVDNQIAYERAAVSAGKLAPENTTSARLEALHDEYLGTLGRPREAGDAAGENAAASASGVSDVRGEAGAGAGRSGRPAGAAAVPGRVTADTLPLSARKDIADARKQYGDAVANRLEAQLIEQARNAPQSVYYPGGELKVRYEVVDLPSLKTSHDTQFNLRKDYPQELQPRARESAPARDQVNNMAARLQPERLGPSPEANSGAPIVGPDGIVESGNGRTLAIAKAYQKGNTAYRDWLESQGYDTAGMSQPVLIARRVSDMTPAQREFFTNSANASSTLRMSAAEQAAGDAKVLRPDMLAQIVEGPIRSVENRPFVRSFVEKLPAAERGGILDKDGNLSQAGVKRVEAALAARAFDDAAFVARAFDSADSNIRGLAGALTDAAGPWARMREAARDGTIDASHDITSELMNVVHKVMRARDEGRPVGEVLRQNDMFGSDVAPLVESLLFRDPEKGLLAGRQKIAQALKLYAGEAEKNLAGPRLFDDGVRPRDVLKAALEKAQREIVEDATFETGAGERVMSGRQPNFTDAARDRLRAAKDSHIRYTETFKNRPVGPVLKGPFKGRYDLPDSAVPSKAVVAGPKGYETARAFIKAAGNDPVAIGTMLDQALAPLRKPGALLPSGALKPAALEKWKSDFAPALRALDEVNPGFSRQFDNAARATELMVEAGAMALAQRKALQQSEAAKFLKSDKPQDALWSIFTAKDGPRRMRELLRGADPDVVDGLRQIGVDAMLRKLSATAESGTSQQKKLASATFQKFIRDNGQTLSAMYEPRTMNMLRSIATDLERTSRTMGATSIPGQSNTARDLPAKLQKLVDASKDKTLLGAMAAGAAAGYLHTGSGLVAALSGVFGGAAKHVFAALRARGMDKVDEMFKDALLNPERARYYLQKAPLKSGGPGPLDAIARSVRRELMVMPAIDDREGRPFLAKRRADGGAVDSDDPFERAAARTRRAVVNENRADEVMGHKIWAHLGQSLMDAVMAPGDAMKGKFSTAPAVPGQWSDEDEWRALINQRNMDNRALDLAGVMMSGGIPMAEKGAAGIFGGRLARTADHAALARAEKMLATGDDPAKVFKETGWFKGADGHMRFEIDDSLSKLNPNKYGHKPLELSPDAYSPGGMPSDPRIGSLAGQFWHPQLYDAYPQLRGLEASVGAGGKNAGKYAAEVAGDSASPLGIEVLATNPGTGRSVMAHEVQHAIQDIEGFAKGAAYDRANPHAYVKAAGEVEANNVQRRLFMDADQRRNQPPWTTQSVPTSDQIISRDYSGRLPAAESNPSFGSLAPQQGIRAYHGSPHDFDRFDLSKIGTGEGAQAYGHGLYFAENEGVAKGYRNALSPYGVEVFKDGKNQGALKHTHILNDPEFVDAYSKLIPADVPGWIKSNVMRDIHSLGVNVDGAVDMAAAMQKTLASITKNLPPDAAARASDDVAKAYSSIGQNVEFRRPGRMYEVNINAKPEQFLDWDRRLVEQPAIAQQLGWKPDEIAGYYAAQSRDTDNLLAALTGDVPYKQVKPDLELAGRPRLDMTGGEIVRGGSVFDRASDVYKADALRERGVPGVRYLDQGSRVDPPSLKMWRDAVDLHRANGDAVRLAAAQKQVARLEEQAANGTRNYVVFDDKLIDILRKYGLAGMLGGAGAMAATDQSEASSP